MQQRTRVKICGLTRLEDVQAVVDAGADAIGLVFYEPSPRAVSIPQAAKLTESVPAFVAVTGLFVNAEAEAVESILQTVKLDLLQFHGDETAEFCEQFQRPYIKAIRVSPETDLKSLAARYVNARGLLLDTYRPGLPGGTGETFDWDLIPDDLDMPVILAGGLTAVNIHSAIDRVKPYAVDVSGGVESSKGIKDPTLIQNLMKEVSCANKC